MLKTNFIFISDLSIDQMIKYFIKSTRLNSNVIQFRIGINYEIISGIQLN